MQNGTIIPIAPNVMLGTDAYQVCTRLEGTATIFVAIDHYSGDVVGIHAASKATRYEALEPIYQGIRDYFGPLEKNIANGLILRHDHGSQYMSHYFQDEIRFLGISSSPSFVKAPEGNGVAERFIRTLKKQLLWVQYFDTVEALREALLDFKKKIQPSLAYTKTWISHTSKSAGSTSIQGGGMTDQYIYIVPLPEEKKVGVPPPSALSGSTHGNIAVKDAPKAHPKGLSLTAIWSVLLAILNPAIQSPYLSKIVFKKSGALHELTIFVEAVAPP